MKDVTCEVLIIELEQTLINVLAFDLIDSLNGLKNMVLVAYAQATTQLPTAVCAPINPGAGSWAKAPTNNGAAGTS